MRIHNDLFFGSKSFTIPNNLSIESNVQNWNPNNLSEEGENGKLSFQKVKVELIFENIRQKHFRDENSARFDLNWTYKSFIENNYQKCNRKC